MRKVISKMSKIGPANVHPGTNWSILAVSKEHQFWQYFVHQQHDCLFAKDDDTTNFVIIFFYVYRPSHKGLGTLGGPYEGTRNLSDSTMSQQLLNSKPSMP